MCGIFGVFTNLKAGFTNDQMSLLGQSIIINQFRGTDSTGLMAIDSEDKSSLIKVLGGAPALFSSPEWDPFKDTIFKNGHIVVGHGRAATRGTVKIENAHPFAKTFTSGEVLKLVHNGTLEWEQDLPDFEKFSVDSEWIAEMLVKFGPKEALSSIRGAMALVWWNEQEKTINFFRNNARPLHFNRYNDKYNVDTFLLASEAAAVKFLAERNGLEPEDKKTEVFYFKPNTHYALKSADLFGDWATHAHIPEPKSKIVVWKNPRSTENYYEDLFPRSNGNGVPQRTYTTDLEGLKNETFKAILFQENGVDTWQRTTIYPEGTTLCEVGIRPYIYGLRRMERELQVSVNQEEPIPMVRVTYDMSEGKSYSTLIHIHNDAPSLHDPLAWNSETYYKGFVDTGARKLSPGRKLRWTSKSGSSIIRHKAFVGNKGGCTLKSYENSLDGAYSVGDYVEMEVTSMLKITLKGRPYWKLDGNSLKTTMDRCVDVVFYVPEVEAKNYDIDDEYYPIIAGTISKIELASQPRFDETGAHVLLVLGEAKLLKLNGESNAKTAA